MKAAVRTRYGPPEVVRICEVERPVAGDNELIVRVHATTVNKTDAHYRSGKPFPMRPLLSGLFRPKATVLGNEFAGRVETVGRNVTSVKAGDKVFGYNEGPFGAHAEYLRIAADGLIATIPGDLGYAEAAPSTEGSHYALSHLRRAGIRSGQQVLVYGASGAIGSAAVQLLKAIGADVTAVCATAQVELVRGLGADKVVDYTVTDFTRDDRKYDVVFDAVGKTSFTRCRRLLKPRGIFMATDAGPMLQNVYLPLLTPFLPGRKVLFAVPRFDRATLAYLRELLESGKFRPVIDRCYPLDQIVEAYRYVETGQKIGNVVITVGPAS